MCGYRGSPEKSKMLGNLEDHGWEGIVWDRFQQDPLSHYIVVGWLNIFFFDTFNSSSTT